MKSTIIGLEIASSACGWRPHGTHFPKLRMNKQRHFITVKLLAGECGDLRQNHDTPESAIITAARANYVSDRDLDNKKLDYIKQLKSTYSNDHLNQIWYLCGGTILSIFERHGWRTQESSLEVWNAPARCSGAVCCRWRPGRYKNEEKQGVLIVFELNVRVSNLQSLKIGYSDVSITIGLILTFKSSLVPQISSWM